MLYKKNPSAYTRCEKCRHIDRDKEECRVTNDKWLVCDAAGECRQFSQEGVNMKVRCINNKALENDLELGKEYESLECKNTYAIVIDGMVKTFFKYRFEKVNDDELDVDLSSKYHIHNKKPSKNPLEEKINKDKGTSINVEMGKISGMKGSDFVKAVEIATNKLTEEARKAVEDNCNVDHPNHYNKGKFEVIEVIEDWNLGFNLGNTIKYIARAKHKGKELEDLEKAMWYLNREIERVKASE